MSSKNKRAVIGSFTVTFVATVIIILILIGYALLGVFFKTFEGHKDEVDVKTSWRENPDLAMEISTYSDSFLRLIEVRRLINSGKGVDEALEETRAYVEYKKIEGGDYMPPS